MWDKLEKTCLLHTRAGRFLLALLLGSVLAAVLSFAGFMQNCENLRQNTLRLHVVAHSDSAFDQSVKLQVRDALLCATQQNFAAAQNLRAAVHTAEKDLSGAEDAALTVLRRAGADYGARARLCEMYFPTTRYTDAAGENYTLPAGRYTALRVVLGQGRGKNWFCVLFPQLCLPAAEKAPGYSEELESVARSEVQLRFALVEWVESLREKGALPSRNDSLPVP